MLPHLESVLTCPQRSHQLVETRLSDAFPIVYECANCTTVLRPLASDGCVFCSDGT
ncbi:GDCCVxC domain-containing (seleno)protein [Spirosoma aerophilum]